MYRLKRSVEMFASAHGSLYLLRAGTGEDLEITESTAAQRAAIELLSRGWWSEPPLREAIERSGFQAKDIGQCLLDLDQWGLLERRRDEELLSRAEQERFDRQLIYWADLAVGSDSAARIQHRLAKATVVILGCGGLGSWAASALACAGVESLVLIDDDVVEPSNLNRQLLFTESDLGQSKVDRAAAALRRHNSALRVRALRKRIESPTQLRAELGGADALILTADWPQYLLPRWTNRACLDAGVPYIMAGQFPPRVRVGPMVIPGKSACWECIESQARREHTLYDEITRRPPTPSTAATLGAASGVAGSLLAMETIHLLTRAVVPATSDAAVVIDLRTLSLTRDQVRRSSDCSECATPQRP